MSRNTLLLQAIALPLFALSTVAQSTGSYGISDGKAPIFQRPDIVIESKKIDRVEVLENFFTKYDSPLKGNAKTFVEVADKYGMDYKLLPAISCMESSCAKHLIVDSYNPFGWGIYGKNAIYFKNYDEAIETVGKGIAERYINRGFDSVAKIAPIYTPPNSRNWGNGVNYFISKINEEEVKL